MPLYRLDVFRFRSGRRALLVAVRFGSRLLNFSVGDYGKPRLWLAYVGPSWIIGPRVNRYSF